MAQAYIPSPVATPPSSDMLRLATSSDFAVIGKVMNTITINKRMSEAELLKLDDLGKALGGTLYTIQIEEIITSRANFMSGNAKPPAPGNHILIFKPRDASYSPNELYVKGQKYLMFLVPINDQERLLNKYKLDRGQTYYRAFEPDKGVVHITPDSLSLVTKFRQLGEAVSPVDPQTKLKRLKALSKSPDEDLKRSAEEAIRIIRESIRR